MVLVEREKDSFSTVLLRAERSPFKRKEGSFQKMFACQVQKNIPKVCISDVTPINHCRGNFVELICGSNYCMFTCHLQIDKELSSKLP